LFAVAEINILLLLLLLKIVDNQYVDTAHTFLGRCMTGADSVPVHGLYEPQLTRMDMDAI